MKVLIDIPQNIIRKVLSAIDMASDMTDDEHEGLKELIKKRENEPVNVDLSILGEGADDARLAIATLAISAILESDKNG